MSTETESRIDDDVGRAMFRWRDYTPIPLIVILLAIESPTVISATMGTLILVFGEMFRIYSVSFIGSISRTRKDHTGTALVDVGPFAWVRNPLYIGNFLIVFGLSVYAGSLWFTLLVVALFAFQYYHIVRYEEKVLHEKFGEEYARYTQRVPAWIPKKWPSLSELAWPETFTPAIKSERRTLTTLVALLTLLMLLAK